MHSPIFSVHCIYRSVAPGAGRAGREGVLRRAKAHPFELRGQVPLPSGAVKIQGWGPAVFHD